MNILFFYFFATSTYNRSSRLFARTWGTWLRILSDTHRVPFLLDFLSFIRFAHTYSLWLRSRWPVRWIAWTSISGVFFQIMLLIIFELKSCRHAVLDGLGHVRLLRAIRIFCLFWSMPSVSVIVWWVYCGSYVLLRPTTYWHLCIATSDFEKVTIAF